MIRKDHPHLSLSRQCRLVGISRSGLYYKRKEITVENLALMRLMDEQYLRTPFYGSRRMTVHLRRLGHSVNHKRVGRLMRIMRLEAIYPKPGTSIPHPGHGIHPYLLREMEIVRPNQVWAADITYVPMAGGFMYLVAILDWATRKVLAFRVSNSMEADFCVEALQEALAKHGRPEIFNIRAASSPVKLLREPWRLTKCASAWMAEGGAATISSSKGCGGLSITRPSTSTPSMGVPTCGRG